MHTWIIENKLAQSPLPNLSEINKLNKYFTGVVVLTMQHEMPLFYIDKLLENGLDVLHLPTFDHHPVDLLDLLRAILFIEKHIREGGAVLVHCYGGVGRSGLTTSAYLVYKGLNLYDAVKYVRSKVPGSLENQWQLQILEDLYTLINTVGSHMINEFMKFVNKLSTNDVVSYKHLSKVLQFTIELYNILNFAGEVDLKKETESSMIHIHREDFYVEIVNSLGLKEINESLLANLSHTLDHTMDSRVVVLYDRHIDKPEVMLLCRDNCNDIATVFLQELRKYSHIITDIPDVYWDIFLNYV
ncbi:MAG: dual specificity protein phosphatase family protein [Desulfurococcaceae archaeon]